MDVAASMHWDFLGRRTWRVAGRPINDHQVRLFMTHRRNDPVAPAAAKTGFSPATGYRVLHDARMSS